MTKQTTTTAAAIIEATRANYAAEQQRGTVREAYAAVSHAERAHEAARENGNPAAIQRTAADLEQAKTTRRRRSSKVRTYSGLNTPEGYAAAPQRIRAAWERNGGKVSEDMREAAQEFAATAEQITREAAEAAAAALEEAEAKELSVEFEAECYEITAEAADFENEATKATRAAIYARLEEAQDAAEEAEAAAEEAAALHRYAEAEAAATWEAYTDGNRWN